MLPPEWETLGRIRRKLVIWYLRHLVWVENNQERLQDFYQVCDRAASAYSSIPASLWVQGSLFSFLILGAGFERHPMIIPIALGGGLAMALTVNGVVVLVRRFV